MIPLTSINNVRRTSSPRWAAYLAKHGRKLVRIWSNEHRCWWRPNKCGYTTSIEAAGVYTFADALEGSQHAGPEKQIFYAFIRPLCPAAVVPAYGVCSCTNCPTFRAAPSPSKAAAPRKPKTGPPRRYLYRGDAYTRADLRGAAGEAETVAGWCIVGKLGTMLVRFDSGEVVNVLRRQLRKVPAQL